MAERDPALKLPPTVDLTNCDREPIHLIGAVQSAGFLVAISADWIVARVSANAAEHLGRPVDELLGESFRTLVSAEAVHLIRNRLSSLRGADGVERAFAVQLQDGGQHYDLAIHMTDASIVIEAEPSEPPGDLNAGAMVRSMLGRLQSRRGLGDLTREATRLVKALTGFDRVMIYRFHPDHSGEVIAEQTRAGLPPFLGLRYPASDIPAQARALLVRNPVRVLTDVDAPSSPIVPQLGPDARPLDLSMSILRAPSEIHLEYLRNMGVRATLTISLVRNGQLWGMVACHHMVARHIGFERRTTAELFAQMLSLLIEREEREEIMVYEERTRQLHHQLMAVVDKGSVAASIVELADRMAEIVPCNGIAVVVADDLTLTGATPTPAEFAGLRRFLDRTAASQVFATESLGAIYPPALEFSQDVAGLLAIPISRTPRDYLVFFRHEVARSVNWAGDPTKPVGLGPNGPRLTPRQSFAAWREIVRNHSVPWTPAELSAAEALRVTLLEVVLRLIDLTSDERRAAAQKQEVLIAELNHRVRNILGLIRGLVAQSRTSAADVDTYASVLGERVHALARAHDQITADNWGPGSLSTLIATEAGAYLGGDAKRVELTGPPVQLKPSAFSTVALVIHELITNAAKYGGLSGSEGHVAIGWSIGTAGELIVDWCESGGPPVSPPTRRGFGSTIIERSIPHELDGSIALDYAAAGLQVRFTLPAEHIVVDGDAHVAMPLVIVAPLAGRKLSGTVLLVEDNMIIALDAEEMLVALGADSVLVASNVAEAMRLLELETPAFALLDVNLGNETSFAVARRLRELAVPHIFATGYGNGTVYPPEDRATPSVTKPYTVDSLALTAGLRLRAMD